MRIHSIEAIPLSYPEPNDFDALRHICLAKITADAFDEDKAILEAQQQIIALDPETATVNVNADWGGVQATRMMEQLIGAERARV